MACNVKQVELVKLDHLVMLFCDLDFAREEIFERTVHPNYSGCILQLVYAVWKYTTMLPHSNILCARPSRGLW